MSNLNPAYSEALDDVSRTHGKALALVVQAVLEYKVNLEMFERQMDIARVKKPLREQLVAAFVEQISDSVATMCGLIGKGFKAEVMPLVEKVNTEARKNNSRHLQ